MKTLSKRVLITIVIFTMYFSFLYINLFLFFGFVVSSGMLIYNERNYLYGMIKRYKLSIYTLFVYLIALSMPFVIFDNFSTSIYFLLSIWSILLALVFLKDTNILYVYTAVRYLLFVFIGVTLIYLYVTYGKYPVGYKLEYMINDKVSANGVTSFLNIILGVYTALKFKLFKKHTLIASLFVLYIAIEGYGRGSIIFALGMIFINIFFIYGMSSFRGKFLIAASLVGLLTIASPYIYEVYQTTKLATGFETPRITMLKQYIDKINVYSFFFGASYEGTIIASKFHNNPHITYVRTHHIFGIFYIFALMFLIGKQLLYTIKHPSTTNTGIFLIVLNVLIRNISEPLFFPTLFDSLFLVMLFVISKKDSNFISTASTEARMHYLQIPSRRRG